MINREGESLDTFLVELFGPVGEPAFDMAGHRIRRHYIVSDADKLAIAQLPAMLKKAEEELTGLLPEGYRIQITSAPDCEPGEED